MHPGFKLLCRKGLPMPLTVLTIPCRSDNYAFVARCNATGQTALIDAPEAQPIKAALAERGWGLDMILITHHHHDHVEAVDDLRAAFGAKLYGAAADQHRLPALDHALTPGDRITIGDEVGTVWDVSGHTIGHIAFIFDGAAFTGDSLMGLGCGRLFEGTGPQMWDSLRQFETLPGETLVYSGHEYSAGNAAFAVTIEPGNVALAGRAADIQAARSKDQPTIPSALSLERATNPFLRAHLPSVKAALDMDTAPDAEVFTEIRARKDAF
jgi:hydroxyacylglutathione hydrolase